MEKRKGTKGTNSLKKEYKDGDVVVVDVERARKEVFYMGPAIVTVNGPMVQGFKETMYGVAEKYILGHATELMKELV